MALRKISSIIQALQLLADGHDLYDRFGNVVVWCYLNMGELATLYYRPKTVRRMMTVDEANEWRALVSSTNEDWVIQVSADRHLWRSLFGHKFNEPLDNYRRAQLIEGEVFQPIDFSIEVEE